MCVQVAIVYNHEFIIRRNGFIVVFVYVWQAKSERSGK